MSRLGTPAAVALLALVLAAGASPDLPLLSLHRAAGGVLAGLSALFVIALADRRAPGRLVALGTATVALALGYDALRGQRGRLALEPGQGSQTFQEVGPGGRELGLRPLGGQVALQDVEADGTAVLADVDAQRPLRLSPRRAVAVGGYRIGAPRTVATGTARLVLRLSDGASGDLTLREGETARAGDLEIGIERYFPDFALDQRQQPFSRSDEPRNPAALLQVRRGTSSWRLFVIRAMPGIHRPAGLDRAIILADVVPDPAVEMAVSREPAALLAGLGLVVAMVGVAWGRAG